jgi:hypothetical protein
MVIEGDKDEAIGFIYPQNCTMGKNKFYVGYADDSIEDFLVLWGAGKRKGLFVHEKNVNARLFLQILHKGKNIINQTLSLRHTKQTSIKPISSIELVPAVENEDTVRMNLSQEEELCTISFMGSIMPLYYSRWFPPRPSRGEAIRYFGTEAPPITIKFKAEGTEVSTNINSDIDVFLGEKKIAEIAGDWRYSWPHAELFTVFGDSDYLVLRFWLYWIHENYSTNPFLGGDALLDELGRPKDEETARALWESVVIESPDIERFDFLIDLKKKAVSWVGTDYHYQEYWYELENAGFAGARIANDVGTIVQVLKKLKYRFDPPENSNPIERLKKILREEDKERLDSEAVQKIKEYLISNLDNSGNVTYRAEGITRKHVPYVKNGKTIAQLVSSVVTG